jgi:NAD+ synthase
MTQTMTSVQLHLLDSLDCAAEIERMESFLREHLHRSGLERFVIGLSGGIDSAVVAKVAIRAVGADHVLLVRMPYGRIGSSRFAPSTVESLDDAQLVIDSEPGVVSVTVNIASKVDATVVEMELAAQRLDHAVGFANRWETITSPSNASLLGNLKARARADVLRCMANQYDGLVLGTENLSEFNLGYMTKGGDEESDLEVLSPFLKTQVRALARHLGAPQPIIDKAPSADLWADQTDEGELGFTYAQADCVFWAGRSFSTLTSPLARRELPSVTQLPSDVVNKVIDRFEATAHKRAERPTYSSERLLAAARELAFS